MDRYDQNKYKAISIITPRENNQGQPSKAVNCKWFQLASQCCYFWPFASWCHSVQGKKGFRSKARKPMGGLFVQIVHPVIYTVFHLATSHTSHCSSVFLFTTSICFFSSQSCAGCSLVDLTLASLMQGLPGSLLLSSHALQVLLHRHISSTSIWNLFSRLKDHFTSFESFKFPQKSKVLVQLSKFSQM